MSGVQQGIALHLYSGIPILCPEGEWNEAAQRLLTESVERLILAGHTEIIINFTRAMRLPLPELDWLEPLERLAKTIRARSGSLDIVGTAELVQASLCRSARTFLRWATTEEEALSHIKGIPIIAQGQKLTTHLRRV